MNHTLGPWEWDKRMRTWGLYPKGKVPNCHSNTTYEICRITPEPVEGADYWQGAEWQHRAAALLGSAPAMLSMLLELQECAEYWSEYDVPLGLKERLDAVIREARGEE